MHSLKVWIHFILFRACCLIGFRSNFYDLLVHNNQIFYFWLELQQEMIIWSFKSYCTINIIYGTGDDAIFKKDGNCNDDELINVDIHSNVTYDIKIIC